jgi:hypothetical protein
MFSMVPVFFRLLRDLVQKGIPRQARGLEGIATDTLAKFFEKQNENPTGDFENEEYSTGFLVAFIS